MEHRRTIQRLVAFTSVGCVSLCAVAQSAGSAGAAPILTGVSPTLVEQPGRMEFSGRLMARPRDDADSTLVHAALAPFQPRYTPGVETYLFALPDGETEQSLSDKLLSTGLFAWVRPDWILYPLGGVIPNDPSFSQQWHLNKIAATEAWRIATSAPGYSVGIVDTGVDLTHPEFAGNLVNGYCSHITSRTSQVNGGVVTDANGHGTSVAGVTGALGNNSYGSCGVGWSIRIMPIRASNPNSSTGGASFSDIQQGCLWSSNNGSKVLNASWTGVAEPGVQNLGATLRTRNVVLVWPMDDNNTNFAATFDHPDVIVTSGTDINDDRYNVSSYGLGVDLAAPAVNIWTTTVGGGYAYRTGNSFAGPAVAGLAAMAWSIDTSMTTRDVALLLQNACDDIGPPGEDANFGAGRINAWRTLWMATARAAYFTGRTPTSGPFSVDDLYGFFASPRDITLDGVINDADYAAAASLTRWGEFDSLSQRRD